MADINAQTIPPPNLLERLDHVLPLVRLPRLGLVSDFDGTISEIVPIPDEARVAPGCAEPLGRLARKLALVSVVSGRAAGDLRGRVGLDGVVYIGNHGAEYLTGGRLNVPPGAGQNQRTLLAVFDHLKAKAGGPGIIWQDKGFSASVHYRLAPDTEETRRALTAALESAEGVEELDIFWGKRVLEFRARTGLNKGYAVKKVAQDQALDGVIFLGDDTTDIDGLRTLRDLVAQGHILGLGVAVIDDDSPGELLAEADYSLRGVPEVEVFLGWLANAVE